MNFNGRVGLVTQLLPVPQGPVGSPTIKSLPLQAALQCSNVCLSSVRYPGGQTFVHIASGKATQQPLGSIKSGTDDQHTRVWMTCPALQETLFTVPLESWKAQHHVPLTGKLKARVLLAIRAVFAPDDWHVWLWQMH